MDTQLILFGDSITWGAWDLDGGWAQRLKRYADSRAMEDQEPVTWVYPLGVSGDTSRDLLTRLQPELIARADTPAQTAVVIAIGINDSQIELATGQSKVPLAELERNLTRIVETAQQYADRVVLVGLPPVDDALVYPMPWKPTHGYQDRVARQYDQTVATVAQQTSCEYVSVYQDFMERGGLQLLDDGLHPNAKGHAVMYANILA